MAAALLPTGPVYFMRLPGACCSRYQDHRVGPLAMPCHHAKQATAPLPGQDRRRCWIVDGKSAGVAVLQSVSKRFDRSRFWSAACTDARNALGRHAGTVLSGRRMTCAAHTCSQQHGRATEKPDPFNQRATATNLCSSQPWQNLISSTSDSPSLPLWQWIEIPTVQEGSIRVQPTAAIQAAAEQRNTQTV